MAVGRRATLALVATALTLLGVSASAAAAPIELAVPSGGGFTDQVALLGRLTIADGEDALRAVVATQTTRVFAPGATITVCPLDAEQGVLATLLLAASADCVRGTTHDADTITFGNGTSVAFAADVGLADLGPASLLVAFPDSSPTAGDAGFVAATSAGPVTLTADDTVRLAARNGIATARIDDATGTSWYNGTSWAFVVSSSNADLDAAAWGAAWDHRAVGLAIEPARGEAAAQLPPLSALLDIQSAMLGFERRDARVTADGVMAHVGRVPAILDLAFVGHLQGRAGNIDWSRDGATGYLRMAGGGVTLDAEGWRGDVDVSAALGQHGVALGDHGVSRAPWWAAIALWIGALVVVTQRRHILPLTKTTRLLRASAFLGAWLIVDLWTLRRGLGVSATNLAFVAGEWTQALAVSVFEAATLLTAWWLFLVPGRVVALRLLTHPGPDGVAANRRDLVIRGATHVVWLAWVGLFPATVLALGYAVARL